MKRLILFIVLIFSSVGFADYYKNVADQNVIVFAYDKTTGAAKSGDACNITAYITSGSGSVATMDTNPTEIDSINCVGLYLFNLTQEETNHDKIVICPNSTTTNILMPPVTIVFRASIDQTGDSYARLGVPAGASVSADIAAIKAKYTFTKCYDNPIISPTEGWEGSLITEPSVLYEDGTFEMWYRGNAGDDSKIGYATSDDGITWSKQGVVLEVEGGLECSFVLKVESTYYLYARKRDTGDIYCWTSSNGTGWNIANEGEPVLIKGSEGIWDNIIYNCSVYYEANDFPHWKMLYDGWGLSLYGIGYAYSDNGLDWYKYSYNPVVDRNRILPLGWSSTGIGNPSAIKKIGSIYYTWITGEYYVPWIKDTYRIGMISSSDFVNWRDNANNPQITSSETWENDILTDVDILYVPTGEVHKIYLYYNGGQNKIGLAYSDVSLEDFVSSLETSLTSTEVRVQIDNFSRKLAVIDTNVGLTKWDANNIYNIVKSGGTGDPNQQWQRLNVLCADWLDDGRLDLLLDNAAADSNGAYTIVKDDTYGNAAIRNAMPTKTEMDTSFATAKTERDANDTVTQNAIAAAKEAADVNFLNLKTTRSVPGGE